MTNWNRQYRISAGPAGGTGFEIGEEKDGRALHVSFNVEKTPDEAANECKLQVWNLSDEHMAMLKEKNCVVEIRAGYGGSMYPVYKGTVSEVTEELDGGDYMIECELVELLGEFSHNSTISLTGEVVCQQVADFFLQEMGIPSVVYTENATKLLTETKYDNGFSYVGKSKEGFTSVLNKCGLQWSSQNGVVQVYQQGETITLQAYQLDATSGLIEIPKKIKIKKDKEEIAGYEINYLMNGAIGVNDLVSVTSKHVSGTFRVYKLNIVGDNYDGDWICTAQVLEVGK